MPCVPYFWLCLLPSSVGQQTCICSSRFGLHISSSLDLSRILATSPLPQDFPCCTEGVCFRMHLPHLPVSLGSRGHLHSCLAPVWGGRQERECARSEHTPISSAETESPCVWPKLGARGCRYHIDGGNSSVQRTSSKCLSSLVQGQ